MGRWRKEGAGCKQERPRNCWAWARGSVARPPMGWSEGRGAPVRILIEASVARNVQTGLLCPHSPPQQTDVFRRPVAPLAPVATHWAYPPEAHGIDESAQRAVICLQDAVHRQTPGSQPLHGARCHLVFGLAGEHQRQQYLVPPHLLSVTRTRMVAGPGGSTVGQALPTLIATWKCMGCASRPPWPIRGWGRI